MTMASPRLLAALVLCLLQGCAGNLPWQKSPPPPPSCPPAPPCPACETPECPVIAPQIIEKEKIVTRTVKVPVPAPRPEDALALFGHIERVHVESAGITLEGRIDTGAESCSIHAEDITLFERDGKNYVRFTIPDEGQGAPTKMELRLKRKVLIKRKGGAEPLRRYVVRMWLKIGKVRERVDVTLADREDFDYPVLIGRNFLTDNALVDVSGNFKAE